jgi:hypothetical protein
LNQSDTEAWSRGTAQGWITFVAVLFGVLGAFNLIDGLAALAGDKHFDETQLFTGNLTAWGILLVGTAALQLLTSVLIFKRNANGQALGVILCVFNVLTHMAFVSVYPVWSLLIIAIDLMIIYGLCIHDKYFK